MDENRELLLTYLELIYNLIYEQGIKYEFVNLPRDKHEQFYLIYDEFIRLCLLEYKPGQKESDDSKALINIDEEFIKQLSENTNVTELIKKTDDGFAVPVEVFINALEKISPFLNKLLSIPMIGSFVRATYQAFKAYKAPVSLGKFCLQFVLVANLLSYSSDVVANHFDFKKLSKALASKYPEVKIKKWDSVTLTNNLLKLFDYKGGYFIESEKGKFYVDEINDGRLQLALAIALGYEDVDNLWSLVGVRINDVYVTAPILWKPNKLRISYQLKLDKYSIFDLLQDFGYRNVVF